jgi:hypothetical protein
MRWIALDVHRHFCEVAVKVAERLRLSGRVKTEPEKLELFASSLAPDDQVGHEASEPALAIARVLEPHVGRVVIDNTRKVRGISESEVKADKLDARTPRGAATAARPCRRSSAESSAPAEDGHTPASPVARVRSCDRSSSDGGTVVEARGRCCSGE